MKPVISINLVIPNPYLPIEEFCRQTGHAKTTVVDMVRDGRITIKRKANTISEKTGKPKTKSKIEINMVELTLRALAESNFDVRLNDKPLR